MDFSGGLNFIFFAMSTGSDDDRRMCTSIMISQDLVFENAETFEIDLDLDIDTSGVILDPNVTEVTILDIDSKN